MEICRVEGCDSPVAIKKTNTCRRCYQRERFQNNPEFREQRKKYVRPEGTPLNPRKSVVSYWAVHQRLKFARGRAAEYLCVMCGEQAQEWALIPGRETHVDERYGKYRIYSHDLNDYMPLCKADHRRLDLGGAS